MKITLFVLLSLAAVSRAQATDLESLMRGLRAVTAVEADYRETIDSVLLEQRLSSSGQLLYRAPGRIIKTSDQGDAIRIEGDSIRIIQGDRHSQFAISEHAGLQTLVLALRATLAGDLDQLRAAYRLSFQSETAAWTLELHPKARRLLPFLERIEITGVDNRIDGLDILESNGDRRALRLSDQRISTADAKRSD